MADSFSLVRASFERRRELRESSETTCWRAVNGDADHLDGITVDVFGSLAVMSLYRELAESEERSFAEAIVTAGNVTSVYVKRRPKEARVAATTQKDRVAPELPLCGPAVEEVVALESGLKFAIRPAQGLSVGLYLDMRDTRRWLRDQVRDATVLNCFAYTCAFGVFALAGGAKRTLNIDLSRRVLDWGRLNAQLNGQKIDDRDFVAGDVFEWLKRFAKKQQTFDVVVLDPPSFARVGSKFFSAAARYGALASAAAACVSPGGLLLACCNLASENWTWFDGALAGALKSAGRVAKSIERMRASPIDFPVLPGKEPPLKIAAIRL